jgi:hypothetical protein
MSNWHAECVKQGLRRFALRAGKRWFVATAALFCLLLLTNCAKNASEAPKNLNAAGQSQAGQPSGSTVVGENTPTLKTRPNVQEEPSSAATTAAALAIPAGTSITVRLQDSLSSRFSVPGQRFDAVLDEPIMVDDRVVVPTGAPVTGYVTSARRSGRLRHPGELGVTLDSVSIGGRQLALATSNIVVRGGSHKKRNLAWIGGGTGGGALIGALAAGGKGALIGSGIGAAAGTTTAFISGKKDVGFTAEHRLRFRLNREVSLVAG